METEVFPLRLRDGDDASCMNLFQAAGRACSACRTRSSSAAGSSSTSTEAATPEEKAKPVAAAPGSRSRTARCRCSANRTPRSGCSRRRSATRSRCPATTGDELTLRIVGTLADSPFQSELLMADDAFARAFPKQAASASFLIRTPPGKEEAVGRLLSKRVPGERPRRHADARARRGVPGRDRRVPVHVPAARRVRAAARRARPGGGGAARRVGADRRTRAAPGGRLPHAAAAVPRAGRERAVARRRARRSACWRRWSRSRRTSRAARRSRGRGSRRSSGSCSCVGLAVASAATAGILRVPVIPALRRE